MEDYRSTREHYSAPRLLKMIQNWLDASGKSQEILSIDDFAPVDELHIRGRKATREVISHSGIKGSDLVLDIGCGLGGTSRVIAKEIGCQVIGVDLVPDFAEVARFISEVTRTHNTAFAIGSTTSLPFRDNSFDVVVSQHVQMNVRDKEQLLREVWRLLKPGGAFCFHELFSTGQDILYPTPWASREADSQVVSLQAWERTLSEVGFERVAHYDLTEVSAAWIGNRPRVSGAMNIGLVLGDLAKQKLDNLETNLKEGRLQVVQSVMKKCD